MIGVLRCISNSSYVLFIYVINITRTPITIMPSVANDVLTVYFYVIGNMHGIISTFTTTNGNTLSVSIKRMNKIYRVDINLIWKNKFIKFCCFFDFLYFFTYCLLSVILDKQFVIGSVIIIKYNIFRIGWNWRIWNTFTWISIAWISSSRITIWIKETSRINTVTCIWFNRTL